MSTFSGSILIARPVAEVFDFVADERNEPHYNPRMGSVRKLTSGPIGKGTSWAATLSSRGRPVDLVIEVVDHDPPVRLASRTTTDGLDIEGVLRFEPDGDSTRMSWSWTLHPRGWLRLLGPLVRLMGERQEREIWTGLKDYLEAGGR